jgi:ABC-type branched-subunit amino acid transport system ATPase component
MTTRMGRAMPPSDTAAGAAAGPVPGAGAVAVSAAGSDKLLTVDGIIAGYGGGDVLRGVSFEVQKGSITCIVGPNGAGKSTLLAAISGMLTPRAGNITFAGEPITGRPPKEILSRGLVLVPQNHSLFRNMMVRENVEMGAFTIRDRSVVRRRLRNIEDLFPIVAERAKEKAGSLSGGQQRLVEFARSLMLDPSLVVLDEPSMGLDPKTLKIVFRTVRQMNETGRTILLVEQNARAGLKLSSHGVVLENGRVRLSGTGREVLEHPEIGALYLGGAVSATPDPEVGEQVAAP